MSAEIIELEKYVTRAELASWLRVSERWLGSRMAEGMPHTLIAGRVKFRPTEAEAWLEAHGHIERRGDSDG